MGNTNKNRGHSTTPKQAMANHAYPVNRLTAPAPKMASKLRPKASVIPSSDASSSDEASGINVESDTASSEEEDIDNGHLGSTLAFQDQRKINPQLAVAQTLQKQAEVPTPRYERVQYRAINGKIVPTPNGWNVHPELTGDLTDLEAESEGSLESDEPQVIESKSKKQETEKDKVKEAGGSFPIANPSKLARVHKVENSDFAIQPLNGQLTAVGITTDKIEKPGSLAQHKQFDEAETFLSRLSNDISKKCNGNLEKKIGRGDKKSDTILKDSAGKEVKDTAPNNKKKRNERQDEIPRPCNLNSLSFFKPPPSSLRLTERELNKQRLHEIKQGFGIFMKWDGIRD